MLSWTSPLSDRKVLIGLPRRRNPTPASDVSEAASRALFWAPNGLEQLSKMCFAFFFQTDWQIYNPPFAHLP